MFRVREKSELPDKRHVGLGVEGTVPYDVGKRPYHSAGDRSNQDSNDDAQDVTQRPSDCATEYDSHDGTKLGVT